MKYQKTNKWANVLLVALLTTSMLIGCSSKTTTEQESDTVDEKVQNNRSDISNWGSSSNWGTDQPEGQPEDQPDSSESESTSGVSTVDTKRVGDDERGYVNIPKNWVIFVDYEPMPGAIQFSDITGSTIITLNFYDYYDPAVLVSALGEGHEKNGAINVKYAKTTLPNFGDTEVFQVYCYFPALEVFLVTYVFIGPSGNAQYIAIEGPSTTITDAVELFEATYSFEP